MKLIKVAIAKDNVDEKENQQLLDVLFTNALQLQKVSNAFKVAVEAMLESSTIASRKGVFSEKEVPGIQKMVSEASKISDKAEVNFRTIYGMLQGMK